VWGVATALLWLGGHDLTCGDLVRAEGELAESVALAEQSGDTELLGRAAHTLARTQIALGSLDAARPGLRVAATAIRDVGTDGAYEHLLATAADWLTAAGRQPEAVTARAAAESFRSGQPVAGAVEAALAAIDAVALDAPPSARDRLGLTDRESEVLALVAAGKSDGEIADQLVISKKTASVHVANIKSKLGAASRVEVATIALRAGLD
jgi:DNA-binding CsgD family transcriptional regulator